MSKDKITVKEMKHDGLVDAVVASASFMRRYRGAVLILVAVVVVVVVVLTAVSYHEASAITAAADELSRVRSKEDLRAVYQQYPETPSAPLALVQLGAVLYDDSEFEEARDSYQLFLKRYPQHPLSAFARMGISYCLESEEKLEEAIAGYGRIGEVYPASSLVAEAGVNIGRCQARLGRRQDALMAYRVVIERFPRSMYAGLAREELVHLLSLDFSPETISSDFQAID